MDKCIRCGKCCIFLVSGVIYNCKHFIKNSEKNFCDIYKVRLGYELILGTYCNRREDVETDYPGCPYNSGKPIHDAYKKRCWKE